MRLKTVMSCIMYLEIMQFDLHHLTSGEAHGFGCIRVNDISFHFFLVNILKLVSRRRLLLNSLLYCA